MKKNTSNLCQATKQFVLTISLLIFLFSGAMAQMKWSNPTGVYSGNMTIMAVVILDNVELRSDMLEVGAFYGEECRGTIMTEYVADFDKYLCFLMVYGETSIPLTFKVYDHETDTEYDANNTIIYNTDLIIGNPVEAYEFIIHTTHTITATAGENGTILPSGDVLVNHGDNQTFTATPDNCYEVDQWKVNDIVVQTGENSYIISNVQENTTIHVTFKTIIWQIGYPDAADVTATFACNNSTLTISGTGEMLDWIGTAAPWSYIKEEITSVIINSGVTTIGNSAFYDCYNLASVYIPNGVTKIGNNAFQSCCNLFSIDIPGSVTYIGGEAFAWPHCGDGLTNVTVNWLEPLLIIYTVFSGIYLPNVNLHVPLGTECTYKSAPIWGSFNVVGAQRIVTPSASIGGSISPNTPQTVNCGSSITFTATPDNCQEVDQWTVNGSPVQVGGNSYNLQNVQANTTIHVTFKIKTYTITATAGANGSITPSGNVTVNCGANQTFNFAPVNSCYEIDQVLVNGVNNPAAVAAGSYTFENVTATHTISVTFKIKTYTITATAGANGSITPSGNVTVNCGANQTFNFSPANSCYEIDQVLVNGVNNPAAVAAGTYTFENVTATHTISITFKIKTYIITATAGANGSITPSGNVTVNCGTSQTFNFAPANSCYEIDQVLVNGVNNPAAVAAGTYTFENVTATHTISVTFKIKTYIITPSAGTGGSISPNTPQTVNCGSDTTFTAIPNENYEVDQWKLNGSVVQTSVDTYTISDIQENTTIEVTFKPLIGIDENIAQNIKIYPNPTTGDIFIQSELSIKRVECYSILGALLLSDNNFNEKISISTLAKGVYILKIYTDNEIVIQKIMKE